jgi:hypothetical protein
LYLTKAAIEKKAKLSKLKAEIELEEKMKVATEKILSVTTGAQMANTIVQLDASSKRLRALKQEYEKVLSPKFSDFADCDESFDVDSLHVTAQEDILKKELEEQLEDELKKRDALAKILMKEKRKTRDSHNFSSREVMSNQKDIDLELISTDRAIAKKKEYLEILASNDLKKIKALVRSLVEKTKKKDYKGHFFSSRQYFKPTYCAICHDGLSLTKNHGMECSCTF